jgi:inosose dehydratase
MGREGHDTPRTEAASGAVAAAPAAGADATTHRRAPQRRLAGAPISWGVCEVPGWGRQLAPERVLGEMASLGLTATELGPIGYLPLDGARTRALLDRYGLRVVAGFVPLVLHEPSLGEARRTIDEAGDLLAALGAEVMVVTPVMDADWTNPSEIDAAAWSRLIANLALADEQVRGLGITLAFHPHVGALVESADEVDRLIAESEVSWCLDTGHLTIGGTDPVEFVRRHAARVVHVHLKDVDADLSEQVRSRALSLVEATRRGLFRPLGRGDADLAGVIGLLDQHGYERWLVVEQDTTLTGEEPPVGHGPINDVQASIEYLASLAPVDGGGVHRT